MVWAGQWVAFIYLKYFRLGIVLRSQFIINGLGYDQLFLCKSTLVLFRFDPKLALLQAGLGVVTLGGFQLQHILGNLQHILDRFHLVFQHGYLLFLLFVHFGFFKQECFGLQKQFLLLLPGFGSFCAAQHYRLLQ